MLGWLIREVTEVTGKGLGYVADEVGDIANAIADIPDTLEKAYNSTNEETTKVEESKKEVEHETE